jgi:hypothetical protein
MAASNLSTYSDCVSSLRTSLKFLESSVETLDNGVSDFPRLVNVLKTVRVSLSTHLTLLLLTPRSTTNSSHNPLSLQPKPHYATKLARILPFFLPARTPRSSARSVASKHSKPAQSSSRVVYPARTMTTTNTVESLRSREPGVVS